jgi:hypothetical protein
LLRFIFLSNEFYRDHSDHGEILKKGDRPYTQVRIDVGGVAFAVPFRSNASHPYMFWTDKANKCGLDFSKTVVITDEKYIEVGKKPHLRQNEFDFLRGKDYIIKKRLEKYIEDYRKAKARPDIPRNKMLCGCSALQYFEQYII